MASYTPTVSVDITLNTTSVTREGFGIPIFVSCHSQFEERVRAYSNIQDLGEDFDVDSNTYNAGLSLWQQSPRVRLLYVGRRQQEYLLTATKEEETTYVIDVTVNGNLTKTFSAYLDIGETVQDVWEDIEAQIDADSDVNMYIDVEVTGTGDSAVLELEPADSDSFLKVETTDTKIITSTSCSETAAEVLEAIEKENTDWYFMSGEDHTDQYVKDMASAIQARSKQYFFSTHDSDSLTGTNVEEETDTLAWLYNNGMTHTNAVWHQDSETNFTEMAFIGYGAPYDAGSIAWGNAQLAGVGISRSGGDSDAPDRALTTNQKTALAARNANFMESEGGVPILRIGITSGGEWIDVIRGVHWLEVEIRSNLRDLLINQKGGKIPYDNSGVNRIKETVETSLQAGVNRNFLRDYVVEVPDVDEVSTSDKIERILRDVYFQGRLTGAILTVQVQGTIGYE